MTRAFRITQVIREHDSKLYAKYDAHFGCISIYRDTKRYESEIIDGVMYTYDVPSPHFVFALTDTWTTRGNPVDWGLEPIMARLKAMDLWSRDVAGDLIKDYEKDSESNERARDNSIESFLLDYRRQFAKTFSDVNTSNLEKKDKRRLQDGNRK